MNHRLIDAQTDDEAWLEQLRRDVYQELFVATWGGWDEARHVRHFAECWRLGHIRIVTVDGVRVGMIQLFDTADAIEVGEIQIAPNHQNRGIGAALLRDTMARAGRARRAVRLSVGLKNDGALRLYERLGMRHVARTDTHNHLAWQPPADA